MEERIGLSLNAAKFLVLSLLVLPEAYCCSVQNGLPGLVRVNSSCVFDKPGIKLYSEIRRPKHSTDQERREHDRSSLLLLSSFPL